MAFKSKTQPLCRYCGKPIKKRTDHVNFWSNEMQLRIDPSYTVPEGAYARPTNDLVLPQSREEAQRLVNQKIVSVRWSYIGGYDERGEPLQGKRLGIDKVTTWDGESYEAELFCGPRHAEMLGRLLARNGHCTMAYQEANEKRMKAARDG